MNLGPRALWTALLAAALLIPLSAYAHAQLSSERGILQLRPDAIELLYEITFSPDEAAHWRLLFDRDRNGRLSPEEYRLMAKGVAERLRGNVKLTFDGERLPVEVLDAKVSTRESAQAFGGKLQALVMLRATDLAPGLRKIGVDVEHVTDAKEPVVVRIEAERCEITEISGAPVVSMEGNRRAIQLRGGWPATILVDFGRPDARPAKK